MRKTSKTARITILLLVLCLISTAMLSGTFAKYTSEYAGEDTALIAKWDVKFNGNEPTTSTAELDLFSHAYNTNIIAGVGDDKIIAPGVSGDFILDVANNGDVAAKMTFDFEVSGTADTVPIEYSIDEENWYSIDEIEGVLNGLPEMQEVAETEGTASETVYWRWRFERDDVGENLTINDKEDTALGTDSVTDNRSTYILTITATAEQIAPATE